MLLAGGLDSGSEEDASSQTLSWCSASLAAAAAATTPQPSCHPTPWLVGLRTDVVRPLVFNYQTKAESCTSKMKSWHTTYLLPYQAFAIISFVHEEGEETVKLN